MPLAIDWYNQIIEVTTPTVSIDMQTLHDFIENEMVSPLGLNYPAIISPEGKIQDPTNPTIYSQIIIILQSPWQIQFWGGSGYTKIYGGKIVGGLSDQPFKATGTAGDITVLESPVDGLTVVSGSGVTEQDKDDIVTKTWNALATAYQIAGTFGAKNQNAVPSETLADYKADVSALATEANATSNKESILAALTITDGKIDEIKLSTDTIPTALTGITELLGLSQKNFFMDQFSYDVNNKADSFRIRTYTNKTSTGTDNDVLETYTVTVVKVGGLTQSYLQRVQ